MIDRRRQEYIRNAILRGEDEKQVIKSMNEFQSYFGIPIGTLLDEINDLIECGWAKRGD
jgi:hypothetical protein